MTSGSLVWVLTIPVVALYSWAMWVWAKLWLRIVATAVFVAFWFAAPASTTPYLAGSRRYPRSTRVLLFLANALFATTGVAFVALSRGLGTNADPTVWAELGDATLGDPLYVAGLVAGLWLVLQSGSGSDGA